MHLLYLDDSGSVSDKSDRYVVLAGFCVNEKQTHWIDKGMNELVRPFREMMYTPGSFMERICGTRGARYGALFPTTSGKRFCYRLYR